ncbi:hypothetical protein, partial [Streptosporangium sp. KLBMP 9127]|nr:hypothetical protein [Streptosporangium sp. KLBMP 9127]
KDNTGKFHGDIPDTTIGTTAAERRRLAKELRDSIKTREEEDAWLGGSDAGHAERMRREREALRMLEDD